jgi:16S rRNA (guanine527-N7)-methyltransferase
MLHRVRESITPERFEEMLRLAAPVFSLSATLNWSDLGGYLAELDRWRQSVNLTGALSADQLVDHALESVFGGSLISHDERVIDIGSGAGFPGLPLAIQRRDLAVTLSEPRGKKAAFLRHVVRELDLQNVEVFGGRADEVGGQTFDSGTIRAVGDPSRALGNAAWLRPRGALIAWTTQPQVIARQLSRRFELETTLLVPGSRRRQIASYRMREA